MSCFRLYAKECLLHNIRFLVFALTQSAFGVIARDSEMAGEWGLMENIALSGCACLVIAALSTVSDQCRNKSPQSVSAINYYLCRNFQHHHITTNTAAASPIIAFSYDTPGTKWLLRGQSIACGVFLFVIGYSIHGTAWLPQISMAAASVCCIFFYDSPNNQPCIANTFTATATNHTTMDIKADDGYTKHAEDAFSINSDENAINNNSAKIYYCNADEEKQALYANIDNPKIKGQKKRKKTLATAICMLFAVFLLAGNGFFSRPQEWTPHNMWLGVVMPSVSAVILCKCSELASNYGIHADRAVAFGMPSVGLTALTFLSLYTPSSLYNVLSIADNNNKNISQILSKKEFLDAFSTTAASWHYLIPYQNNNINKMDNASDGAMYWYRIFAEDTLTPNNMNHIFGFNAAIQNGSLLDTYYNFFFDGSSSSSSGNDNNVMNNMNDNNTTHHDNNFATIRPKNGSGGQKIVSIMIIGDNNHDETKKGVWRAAEKAWGYVSNQTYQYQMYIIPVTFFGIIRPRSSIAIWAAFLAPVLLWWTLTIFMAGFFRGRKKSVVAVWLLSSIVCQLGWHGITFPLILALLFVKLALFLDILPGELSSATTTVQPKAMEEVVLSSLLSSDDEEEKDESLCLNHVPSSPTNNNNTNNNNNTREKDIIN